jgi:hypothetical protein
VGKWLRFGFLLGCACASCKKESPPSYPQPVVTSYPAPAPTVATPTPITGAPALGMPCVSDQDLQCPFSHCLSNRCGGCTSATACKPGSQCLPTWLGYACFPGSAPPAPVPVPAPAAAPAPVPANPADPLDALRARCVQHINEFRTRVTPTPLTRRTDRDACGDTQAQSDGATHTAHGAFGRCSEGGQNECPGWPGALDQVIDQCLAQMFAEGPGSFETGHGHYLNMVEPNFHSVSCGFSTTPSGQTWIVQDFYR